MRGKRFLFFLVMIGLGLALGLAYGWYISPNQNAETTPETLRADYRADYILMVAEIYSADGDLEQSARRLALLGDQPAISIVAEGIQTANRLGYPRADVSQMENLILALQGQSEPQPTGEVP